jgi:hypothetical protein
MAVLVPNDLLRALAVNGIPDRDKHVRLIATEDIVPETKRADLGRRCDVGGQEAELAPVDQAGDEVRPLLYVVHAVPVRVGDEDRDPLSGSCNGRAAVPGDVGRT